MESNSTDPRALNPIKGKVFRYLQLCDKTIHLIAMASNLGSHHVGVYVVTEAPDITCINTELKKLGIITQDDITVNADYFPEAAISRIRTGLRETLGQTDIKFKIHAAVVCPSQAASI